MVNIFHCFFCNKNLVGTPVNKINNEYFFWCDKKCHDKHQEKVEEDNRVSRQWSAFMCNEGPCPKEMQHALQGQNLSDDDVGKGRKKTDFDTDNFLQEKGRRCGKCKEIGHNARSCGKSETENKQRPISKKSKRRRYICGKCGKVGHNARTCRR